MSDDLPQDATSTVPAKFNVFLYITGRLEDGEPQYGTCMTTLPDLRDEITLEFAWETDKGLIGSKFQPFHTPS